MRPVISIPLAVALLGCNQRATPEEVEVGAFNPADVVHRSADRIRIDVHRKDVPLGEMPIIAETLGGLPMTGLADLTIDLTIPKVEDAVKAKQITGTIAASCPAGCGLGNGTSALAMPGLGSVPFGRLDLGAIEIRAVIKGGRLTMDQFDLASDDVELHARLGVDFADEVDASTIDGCVWWKPKEALLRREPKTHALLSTTGATADGEGFFSIKVGGTLGQIKRMAQDCRTRT